MTEKTIHPSEDARRRIDEYLDAIDKALSSAGMGRAERRNIADDVEAQILDMLAARGQLSPRRTDVEALLAELDSPEAYATRTDAGAMSLEPTEGRLSGAAVLGAIWGALGLLTLLLSLFVETVRYSTDGEMPKPEWWQYLLRFTLLPLGLAAPFGTTILGVTAISRIRNSAGRLYGMALALFDSLFFPLLALDAGIFYVCSVLADAVSRSKLLGPEVTIHENVVLIIALVICAAADFAIARACWQAVRLPAIGEPESKPESPEERKRLATLGIVALGFCVGGLILPIVLGFAISLTENPRYGWAYALFVACQVAAFVLGLLSLKHPYGKAAAITSVVLVICSVLFL